ncbi:MAG: hypothetical protein M1829_000961 [Trizodia sp. TS-e1964]|nr:MAG: hypothetical protein M1829_000961 [Trizodia sp. TS-e1964]
MTYRPTYPASLYKAVQDYHKGQKTLLLDLGCGHGVIAREFSKSFDQVVAVDRSEGFLLQCQALTPSSSYPNIKYHLSDAESLPFLQDKSVDIVVCGQAAHFFNYPLLFRELQRAVRPGGTLAFWGYNDHAFVDYPRATEIMIQEGYRLLETYWQQPARTILRNKYQDINPPESEWKDIQRVAYEPATNGPASGEGTLLMQKTLSLGEVEEYIRTFSAVHAWKLEHPKAKRRSEGGAGDVVDELFDAMVAAEADWKKEANWRDKKVVIEWTSVILMARKV